MASLIRKNTTVGTLLILTLGLGALSACNDNPTPIPTPTPSQTQTGGVGTEPVTVNVTTYHNDMQRTGQFLAETQLNRTNVNPTTFGKIASLPVDGLVYAQPLYIQNVDVAGVGNTNLVLVETEHDSVYAFNTTSLSTTPVWKRSFLGDSVLACTACSPASSTDVNAPNIYPEIGITATPVIDPVGMTMYVLAFTKENGVFYHKLHALDLTTGNERAGSPVVITGTANGIGFGSTNGQITFDAQWQLSRAGLALFNGDLIFGFSSMDDQEPSHGWIFSYNASTLKQNYSMITSPNSGIASVWGGAPAIDNSGNIFVATSNDDGNNATILDYGNSIVKLNQQLQITDWFQPYNSVALSEADIDVGSGGVLLVPSQGGSAPNIAVSGGKQGVIYVANQADLGHMNTAAGATSDPNVRPGSYESSAFRKILLRRYLRNTLLLSGKSFHCSRRRLPALVSDRQWTIGRKPNVQSERRDRDPRIHCIDFLQWQQPHGSERQRDRMDSQCERLPIFKQRKTSYERACRSDGLQHR